MLLGIVTATKILITRIEAKELMVEDWLTLNNSTVHQILPVAARTKEDYARELILFLGEGIPQSPPVKLKISQYFSIDQVLKRHAALVRPILRRYIQHKQ